MFTKNFNEDEAIEIIIFDFLRIKKLNMKNYLIIIEIIKENYDY